MLPVAQSSWNRMRQVRWNDVFVWLIAAVTALNGAMALFAPLAQRFPGRLDFLLLPITYEYLGRAVGLVFGFALVYGSIMLLSRKRVAWWFATITTAVLMIIQLRLYHWLPVIFLAFSLAILVSLYDEFSVRSQPLSLAGGIRLLVISLVLALVYGTIGFYLMRIRDFGQDFSLLQSFVLSIREYLLIGNPEIIPHTRHAVWFLDSLGLVGGMSLIYGFYSLFRPLAYRYSTQPFERVEAAKLLNRFGRDSEDTFKLWPADKSYYFSKNMEGFVAYKVAAGVAVVHGEPVAASSKRASLAREFEQLAYQNGWLVAYNNITAGARKRLSAKGLRDIKIGEDAIVSTAVFSTTTIRNKNFRNIMNRFNKQGFEFVSLEPPYSKRTMHQLRAVSNAWLSMDGRKERSFALGYFNERHLASQKIGVVREVATGRIWAFADQPRSYDTKTATIDLMRHDPSAPSNIMDFLLSGCILQAHASGFSNFSLGLAPSIKMPSDDDTGTEERLLGLLAGVASLGFSYDGLRRFKAKFDPKWQPRYIVYTGGLAALPTITLAIARALRAEQ